MYSHCLHTIAAGYRDYLIQQGMPWAQAALMLNAILNAAVR